MSNLPKQRSQSHDASANVAQRAGCRVVVEMEKLIIRSSPPLRDAVTAVEAWT